MKRFGVVALLLFTSLPINLYADAIDQRVQARLTTLYTAGYTLDPVNAGDDNWWFDNNGVTLNGLRVLTADTTSSPTNKTAQTIGFFSANNNFQPLISAGTGSDGNVYSYTSSPGGSVITTPATGASWTLSGPSYLTSTFPTTAFEFGVLADRSLLANKEIGDSQINISQNGGTLLGSNRSDSTQYRAYRLVTNPGNPALPNAELGQDAYVLAFYNFSGSLDSVGDTYNNAASTGGLVAFIVTGVVNPEPGSIVLLVTGLVGIAGYRLRRQKHRFHTSSS
jgi:hypothetical protein